jgi:hypothetical protein
LVASVSPDALTLGRIARDRCPFRELGMLAGETLTNREQARRGQGQRIGIQGILLTGPERLPLM